MNIIKILSISFFKLIIFLSVINADTTEVHYVGEINSNLTAPTSLEVSQDELAVLEPYTNQLKIFTPDGIISKQLTIQGDANALTRLNGSEYLYCDFKKHEVTAIDYNSGNQYNYFSNIYSFVDPIDLITKNNNLYVLDAGNKKIIIFDRNRSLIKQIKIQKQNLEEIHYPSSFTIADDNFYIFDQSKSEIWVLDSNGNFINSFGSFGAKENQITRGGDILSSRNNNILIADRYQNRVVIYNINGNHIGTFPSKDIKASLNIPTGMAIDENGTLYIASTESSKIQIFQITTISSQKQPLNTEAIFPESNDTLDAENVQLIASARSIENRLINGFDFQLFLNDSSSTPVDEGVSIPAKETYDSLINQYFYKTEWKPENIVDGNIYWWRSRVIADGLIGNWSKKKPFMTTNLPDRIELYQNYPNPFNPETRIAFALPEAMEVKIEIFNLTGQRIKILVDEFMEAGPQEVVWDGRNNYGNPVASGVYFYRMSATNFSKTKKMVIIK